MNVRLSKEQKTPISDSTDIYKVMQQVLLHENKIRRNQEHFWVVGLDNAHKILFLELVALGAVNRVNVNPPDVFRMGIYKLAVKMILIHNHPSGNIIPSKSDTNFTDRLLKIGQFIKIEIIDHLIISEKEYISLADEGIIEELQKSTSFTIMDKEQRELEEWGIKTEQEYEVKVNIAKKMLKDGIELGIIKKYTGLTKWEIKKL
ncbi:JAB domain-containing protein [Tenacibaculum maritimum]|uniref:JAB domain-containing protein n=1 Tax=Tenacibaculum maritimum TaxID=107401 RepID=UPI0012E5F46A|nr:JAB domain-containing protein [Tenacibaculum maritimum]MCD9580465.1 JAB domain-containing protein [Tenacibaculum maritimum]MCD9634895.1 JAB domain-containing protein [Tenacibaculum maritimum]CAA0180383.1 DNA repair protein RadC family [Tenacibaculum maritimum]